MITLRQNVPVRRAALALAGTYPHDPSVQTTLLPSTRLPDGGYGSTVISVQALETLEIARQPRWRWQAGSAELRQTEWRIAEDELRDKIHAAEPALHTEFPGVLSDLIGDLTWSPDPVEIKIFATDTSLLKRRAAEIAAAIETIPGVVDVNDGLVVAAPTRRFLVREAAAARLGLTPQSVGMALQTTLLGSVSSYLLQGDRTLPVRVLVDPNAQQQVTAARQLYEKQEMSEVQYGKLLAAAAAAEGARQSAAAQVDLVEAGTRPEEIATGEALVDAAEADLASAQLALEFCTIRSPIAGRVTQLFARAGMFAERAIVLATVTDLSSLFAKVRIPNDHQADLARDAVARVTIAALPNQTFQGKIARLSGQADRTTGNVNAFVQVANPHTLLQPGFACQVHLPLRDIPNALVVPVAAVADRNGTPVLTIVRDQKAYEIEVETGQETADLVQIIAGVKPDDLVVTEGGYGLPDAFPVVVKP